MKLLRTTAAALALTTGLLTLPAQADDVQTSSGDPAYQIQTPKGYAMLGDLIIARPLLIGATAIGVVAFVVSLPFTALGGNIEESAEALVMEPGREASARCLGSSSRAENPH